MSNEAQQILREALKLPLAERADVASELLASLDEPEDEGVEEAWALEIERRARRVLAGESTGTDWVEVRARIASSLPKRRASRSSPKRRQTRSWRKPSAGMTNSAPGSVTISSTPSTKFS